MGNERQDQQRGGMNDPRTNEQEKRQEDNPSRGPGKPGEGGQQSPSRQPPSGDPSRQREQQGDRDDDDQGDQRQR